MMKNTVQLSNHKASNRTLLTEFWWMVLCLLLLLLPLCHAAEPVDNFQSFSEAELLERSNAPLNPSAYFFIGALFDTSGAAIAPDARRRRSKLAKEVIELNKAGYRFANQFAGANQKFEFACRPTNDGFAYRIQLGANYHSNAIDPVEGFSCDLDLASWQLLHPVTAMISSANFVDVWVLAVPIASKSAFLTDYFGVGSMAGMVDKVYLYADDSEGEGITIAYFRSNPLLMMKTRQPRSTRDRVDQFSCRGGTLMRLCHDFIEPKNSKPYTRLWLQLESYNWLWIHRQDERSEGGDCDRRFCM
jgi:hypothetical protein